MRKAETADGGLLLATGAGSFLGTGVIKPAFSSAVERDI
jgi:hypothetical protein